MGQTEVSSGLCETWARSADEGDGRGGVPPLGAQAGRDLPETAAVQGAAGGIPEQRQRGRSRARGHPARLALLGWTVSIISARS